MVVDIVVLEIIECNAVVEVDDVDCIQKSRENDTDTEVVEVDDEDTLDSLEYVVDEIDDVIEANDEMQQHIEVDDDERERDEVKQHTNDENDSHELSLFHTKSVEYKQHDEIVAMNVIEIVFIYSHRIERFQF